MYYMLDAIYMYYMLDAIYMYYMLDEGDECSTWPKSSTHFVHAGSQIVGQIWSLMDGNTLTELQPQPFFLLHSAMYGET